MNLINGIVIDKKCYSEKMKFSTTVRFSSLRY